MTCHAHFHEFVLLIWYVSLIAKPCIFLCCIYYYMDYVRLVVMYLYDFGRGVITRTEECICKEMEVGKTATPNCVAFVPLCSNYHSQTHAEWTIVDMGSQGII